FDEHVKIAIVIEDTRVQQFILELGAAAALTGVNEIRVRERGLRIFVQVLHVRMRRRAVEVEVIFLYFFAVVAFAIGQAEKTLLEDGVLAVPEGEREAELLLVVGDAGNAVLAPAVGAAASLIVAEIVPGVAIFAV